MEQFKEKIKQHGKSKIKRFYKRCCNSKVIIHHSFVIILFFRSFFFPEKDLGALRKENRKSMALSVAILALLSLGYWLFSNL